MSIIRVQPIHLQHLDHELPALRVASLKEALLAGLLLLSARRKRRTEQDFAQGAVKAQSLLRLRCQYQCQGYILLFEQH